MKILILDDNEVVFSDPADGVYPCDYEYADAYVVQVAHPVLFWDVYPQEEWDEIWLDYDLGLVLEGLTGRDVTLRFAEIGYSEYMRDRYFSFNEEFVITTGRAEDAVPMVDDIFPYGIVNHMSMHTLRQFGVLRGEKVRDPGVIIVREAS